jgi:uncharacterized protein YegP (UPF0339 family)
MTRSAQVAHAVSALRKARAAPSAVSESALTFVVYEDNSGGYRWTIVAGGDESLLQSTRYGSYEQAKQAARIVHRGASQAPFEERTGDSPPVDLIAHRDAATARDALDAERWLDEGGSFSREAVTKWPARR